MSDTTTTTPKAKKPKAKMFELSSVTAVVAERKGIDTTKAGKLVRRHVRSHFDTYAKRWQGDRKPITKDNRDGNRYPPMSKSTRDAILKAVAPK